jgi:AraC family transcriptional regulator
MKLESGELLGQVIRSGQEGGLSCHEVFYPGGARLDEHAHASAFFGLSIDGHYRDISGGRTLEARPRSVVFHASGEEHAVAVAEADLRCFVLELDAAEIERQYGVLLPGTVRHANGGPLALLLANVYREFRHPDACSSLAIQGFLLQLLVSASRADVRVEHGHPPWLGRVTELLHQRFRSRLSLQEIAIEVGVSPARISSVFRSVHGRSMAEEQRRLRIEFACRRMLDGHATLAEIAVEAGFADQPHFSRAFKLITGMTPAQYRSMLAR